MEGGPVAGPSLKRNRTRANRFAKPSIPIPEGDFYPFRPRSYQRKIIQAFSIDETTKRPRSRHGIWVVHRRGGKDLTAAVGICLPAMIMRPGNYFHIFPKFAQAKKAIWHEEENFLDRFPPHFNPKRMETELYVELTLPPKGQKGRYYLLGADDTETVSKLVGTNPLGIIYSEAAQMDETVRRLLRPALAENGGWELLISTPRGKNWFHKLYLMAANNSEWFAELLTIAQTVRDSETDRALDATRFGQSVIPVSEIEADRVAGMTQEEIEQEYYCSFEGYQIGTIFGDCIRQARQDGRIGRVPYDPRLPVGAMLDIGRTDLTACWFYQVSGSEIRFIDYWAARGETAGSTIRYLKENRPYHYARIVLPHDAKEKRYQASDSVAEDFRRWFRGAVVVADRLPVQQGISAVRKMFSRFIFDEVKCSAEQGVDVPSGLESLGNYHRKWDDEHKAYSVEPVHDQYSHGADALRVGMIAWEEGLRFAETEVSEIKVESDFDPRRVEQTRGGW